MYILSSNFIYKMIYYVQGEKMIAEVIINTIAKELNKTYDYIIPDLILKDVKIGSRVFVPFGRSKLKEGFVIEIKEKSEFANKEIIKVEDNILTKENVELAKLMAKRYFCNISDCIRLMLPPGKTKVERNPFVNKDIKRDKPLKLTEEQNLAYNEIAQSKYKEFLIYGVTGSRKN